MDTENIVEKSIKVDSIEDTEKKVNLKSGKEKYFFWKHKQDGDQTKAFQQFQDKNLSIQAGGSYEAQVTETPKSFTNEKGKLINYTERKINYFKTPGGAKNSTPYSDSSKAPKAPYIAPQGVTGVSLDEFNELKGRIQLLEDAVFNPGGDLKF